MRSSSSRNGTRDVPRPVRGAATRPARRASRSSSSARPVSVTLRAKTSRAGATGGLTSPSDRQQLLELGQRGVRTAMEDRRHPHLLGARAVLAQVVDEDALLWRHADLLGPELEYRGLGLVHSHVAGDDHGVEQLLKRRSVVVNPAAAPGVRDQAGPDAIVARTLDRPEHRVLGSDAREQPLDEPLDAVAADADPLGEQRLELVGVQLALLEPAQQRERLAVLLEGPLDRVGRQPLRLRELLERLEDVGGEDPAEVDEQALHAVGAGIFVISCAASASCGTPSSKSFRYGSSVVPASERL